MAYGNPPAGADADAIVPGALVVREDFASDNPEAVQKFLAEYIKYLNKDKDSLV